MISRWYSAFWLAAAIYIATAQTFAANFTLTVLDFKTHGLCVVLQTPAGKTWLVDTALRQKEDYYAARDVVGPFLRQEGIEKLDGVVVSHPHADHFGGLPYLLDNYPIGKLVDGGYDEIGGPELITYRKIRAQHVEKGGQSVIVKTGSKLAMDPELEAEVLWPPPSLYRPDPNRKDDALYNANSVVLRVRHGKSVFLFPGDHHGLVRMAEFMPKDKLRCDLLVAPHHGLNSSAAMAAVTTPKLVLVASLREYLNPLIHPYELTKTAFEPVGSTVYATWVHGHITVVSDGSTLKVTTARTPSNAAAARAEMAKP